MSLDLRIFQFFLQISINYMFYLLFFSGHELAWFSLEDDKNAFLNHFDIENSNSSKMELRGL